ncbi:hypothetical protein BPNPMPFG_003759 [Mesorhizobium sp. AR07]|uniref:hypothetical protein n=1 Tax=Mesorhizobium sp. AR07 TaxID=2865838 RepID=UPI00215EFFDC|nr:hypothetical protein [Mesorhizobium sp. AR07]UVK42109.1 hypothetical protein BPNPMPFG_003759 [Mesorhizobium sp. AR07]
MTKIVPKDKARQGGWGRHGLRILIAALLLAFVAWGGVEIYGEMIKKDTTEQGNVPGG